MEKEGEKFGLISHPIFIVYFKSFNVMYIDMPFVLHVWSHGKSLNS